MSKKNNVHYLNESLELVIKGLDKLKQDIISGKVKDIVIVGVNKETGGLVSLLAVDDDILALRGGMAFMADQVTTMMSLGMEAVPVGEDEDEDMSLFMGDDVEIEWGDDDDSDDED